MCAHRVKKRCCAEAKLGTHTHILDVRIRKILSAISPHFLNQAPLRAQQPSLPDLVVPHLGDAELLIFDACIAKRTACCDNHQQ